jgi:hypothetical protein
MPCSQLHFLDYYSCMDTRSLGGRTTDSTGQIAQIVGRGFGATRVAALGRRRDPGWVARREKITGDSGSLWKPE